MEKKTRKEKLKQKWASNYLLVIHSEDTWEEKFSFKINRPNAFIIFSLISIILVSITILIIALTPLREYIPGYGSSVMKRQARELIFKSDSIAEVLHRNQAYINNLSLILSGEIDSTEINHTDSTIVESKINYVNNLDFSPTKEDSVFRSKVETEDRFNLLKNNRKDIFVLTSPISGKVTQHYSILEKHYAIDIAVENGTPVKAVAKGTVIFSEWTSTTGNVIIIEHENLLISVYKHNATTMVEQGDHVEEGEVIASSGSTGNFSTGPHLHFELWYNGRAVNPEDFINFEI